MPLQFQLHRFHIHFMSKQLRQGSHGLIFVCYAAGNDVVEIFKRGVDVECPAVQSRPARKVDADGADFGHWTLDVGHWILDIGHWTLDIGQGPNARIVLDPKPLNSIFRNRSDNYFFNVSDVAVNIREKTFEVEDGVAYYLSWAMERDVATPVDGKKFDAALGQFDF